MIEPVQKNLFGGSQIPLAGVLVIGEGTQTPSKNNKGTVARANVEADRVLGCYDTL